MTRAQFLQHFLLSQSRQYDLSLIRRLTLPETQFRQAAVLIGLVDDPDGIRVILTKRAQHLKHHPGQVSFPGGKLEQHDDNLIHTALRETKEEIGIATHLVDVIGQMPPLPTISYFKVTPVLAFVSPDYQPELDRDEVDSIFEVPLEYLLNPNNFTRMQVQFRAKPHTVLSMPYGNHLIWGVTAQIIQGLQQQIGATL